MGTQIPSTKYLETVEQMKRPRDKLPHKFFLHFCHDLRYGEKNLDGEKLKAWGLSQN
jgi:hypothetical protein